MRGRSTPPLHQPKMTAKCHRNHHCRRRSSSCRRSSSQASPGATSRYLMPSIFAPCSHSSHRCAAQVLSRKSQTWPGLSTPAMLLPSPSCNPAAYNNKPRVGKPAPHQHSLHPPPFCFLYSKYFHLDGIRTRDKATNVAYTNWKETCSVLPALFKFYTATAVR